MREKQKQTHTTAYRTKETSQKTKSIKIIIIIMII